ncbi:urea transport system substrate-binding protein [Paenibacillus sp. V4I3]|uniref:Urea ABC transporter substrate-binding protein n=1 Tax=Paenibacillus alginolyticus TaxID=59839 RepID=A0ABT4GAY4_9BACL|nr:MULTISPECIES: urea ABC transporter substrate-binding protein [Paenibacillus]MCY9693319.1 urea ABC transporter substrate-binding protein [Paenibacillus alginolyticus]MDQ0878318.1 urea transport system substrate-binding protein [Paenibacillus sp. V4I3]MEC0145093.1 urea ABC transporter substrate-binding protein [Paenibacillus alginolyticus]
MREIRNKGKLTVALSMALMMVMAGCAKTEPTTSTTTTPMATKAAEAKAETKDETVPVGILHSLTGTMSISEVSVRDAELMAIDEINAAGGLLGKKIKPVIEDGASDWPTFAEKTKKLLQKDSVVTIFGCWTSASRKAVLPVVEQNKGLLWYPVQYEGVESSPNIFYIGATTNQQIIPAVTWLLQNKGKKFYLLGSDYVFPRTANKIIKEQLKAEGGSLVAEEYTPLGHTDYNTIISKIKKEKPDVIFNTLNGDSNVAFFKQLKDAGISSKDLTTMSVSIAEEEVRGIGASVLDGHYTAWNYYQTTDTPENKKFVEAYKAKYGKDRVTDDPIEAGYTAVYLWAAAVKKAGSFEVEKVKAAAKGIEFNAPEGKVVIDGENQHISKTARIGQITADGQIKEIWNSGQPLKPDPFLKTYPWGGEVTKK